MTQEGPKVLLLAASPDAVEDLADELERDGFTIARPLADSEARLRAALQGRWDVVVAEYELAGRQGPALVAIIAQYQRGVPVIFLSDGIGEARAMAAVRAGARDCVRRDELSGLSAAIGRALAEREQRRHAETAERMHAVGALARRVGHDVNNLLTVIRGYAGLLLETLPGDGPGREDLIAIDRAASAGEELTSKLLGCSRPHRWEPRRLRINDEVVRVRETLQQILGDDIALVTELADHPGEVEFDPEQLESVLVELARNARAAMLHEGRLVIRTADARFVGAGSDEPAGDYVAVTVSDTGTGMTEDTLRRCFDPFFTTRERAGNPGLGLSTAYITVEFGGGYMRSYSAPGVGSTFELLLPRRAPDAGGAPG